MGDMPFLIPNGSKIINMNGRQSHKVKGRKCNGAYIDKLYNPSIIKT